MASAKNAHAAALLLAAALAGCGAPAKTATLFTGRFCSMGPNNLVTNEFAYWNPEDRTSVVSPDWELSSGSLFSVRGAGWTGIPDDKTPDACSSNGNNSAVFRLTTRRADFENVEVSFRLLNRGLHDTPTTPRQPYDGVHIFLRYQTEYHLYYASINRREGTIVIKKKVPGGPSNGGTYYELTPYVRREVPYGKWQDIRATVRNNPDGSVTIELFSGSRRLVAATDTGRVGGPPITNAGKVGLRTDNADALFGDFIVTGLPARTAAAAAAGRARRPAAEGAASAARLTAATGPG